MNSALSRWAPQVLSLLRFVVSLLFLEHGAQKLLYFPPGGYHPVLTTLPGVAGFLELVGGALLALGLFTRPTAFVLSGLMAAAYFMAHAAKSFFPVNNGGDTAILYCFVFFYFVFAGPGPLGLDALRGSRK